MLCRRPACFFYKIYNYKVVALVLFIALILLLINQYIITNRPTEINLFWSLFYLKSRMRQLLFYVSNDIYPYVKCRLRSCLSPFKICYFHLFYTENQLKFSLNTNLESLIMFVLSISLWYITIFLFIVHYLHLYMEYIILLHIQIIFYKWSLGMFLRKHEIWNIRKICSFVIWHL